MTPAKVRIRFVDESGRGHRVPPSVDGEWQGFASWRIGARCHYIEAGADDVATLCMALREEMARHPTPPSEPQP